MAGTYGDTNPHMPIASDAWPSLPPLLSRRAALRRPAIELCAVRSSAGGIRVLAHLDALRAMLPSTVALTGFADSGFYLDVDSFTHLKRFVVSDDGHNATRLLSSTCVAAFPGEKEKCLIAQRAAPFLQTPTYVWQSRYDLDQRSCEITPACAASTACVDAYAGNLSSAVHEQLLSRRWPHHGAFIDACGRHCDDGLAQPLQNPTVDAHTPLQAFALWHATRHLMHARAVWEAPGGQQAC